MPLWLRITEACAPGGETFYGERTIRVALWRMPCRLNPTFSTFRIRRIPGRPTRRGSLSAGQQRKRHTAHYPIGIAHDATILNARQPDLPGDRQ